MLRGSLDELDAVRLVLLADHLLGRLVVDELAVTLTDDGTDRGPETGVPRLDGEDGQGSYLSLLGGGPFPLPC
jgi:hypothetical protein